jgi:hypothetical protein
MLTLVVVKLDQYGQTITADSSSSLQVYSALEGTKVNDNSLTFIGNIISGFREGRAVFSIGVKPTFSSVGLADGRSSSVATNGRAELQRKPYIYLRGADLTTAGVIMETDPQQVHLASGNRTACPVGSVLLLEPPIRSEWVSDPRPGTCKVCDPGLYNVYPISGRCLPCPPSAMCRNGAPPLFGARKVAGAVVMKLPDGGDDAVLQALAEKLGVAAWQLTVLPQQLRRHNTRAEIRGAAPATLATAQTRRTVTVSFELVADEAQMAKLAVSLPALGVKLGEIKSIGPQVAAGEVWEEVSGVFMLRKCQPGFKLISSPIEMQQCSPCGKGKYIIEGSTDCVDCPVFSLCFAPPLPPPPPGACCLLWLAHSLAVSLSPRMEPTAPTAPNSCPESWARCGRRKQARQPASRLTGFLLAPQAMPSSGPGTSR